MFPQGQKKKMYEGKEFRIKLMPVVYSVQGCSLKTKAMKNAFDTKNVYAGHTMFVRTI